MSTSSSGKPRTAAQARQDNNRDQGGRFGVRTWQQSTQSLTERRNESQDYAQLVNSLDPGQGALDVGLPFAADGATNFLDGATVNDENCSSNPEWSHVSIKNSTISLAHKNLTVQDGSITCSDVSIDSEADLTNIAIRASNFRIVEGKLSHCTAEDSTLRLNSTEVEGGTYAGCNLEFGSLHQGEVSNSALNCTNIKESHFSEGVAVSGDSDYPMKIHGCTGRLTVAAASRVTIGDCEFGALRFVPHDAPGRVDDVLINDSKILDYREDSKEDLNVSLSDSFITLAGRGDAAFHRVTRSHIRGSGETLYVTGNVEDSTIQGDFVGSIFDGSPYRGDLLDAKFGGRYDRSSFRERYVRGTFRGSYRHTDWRGSRIIASLEGDFSGADMRGVAFDPGVQFGFRGELSEPMIYDDETCFPDTRGPESPGGVGLWVHIDHVSAATKARLGRPDHEERAS